MGAWIEYEERPVREVGLDLSTSRRLRVFKDNSNLVVQWGDDRAYLSTNDVRLFAHYLNDWLNPSATTKGE